MKPVSLTLKAGAGALRFVRNNGFDISSIGTIVGASGGAKWLALSQLDRAILELVVPKLTQPVHLLGSSIGAWRFACYAQDDPIAAIARFEEAYIEQQFSETPDAAEITTKSREIIGIVLGDNGIDEILSNPILRTHVMAVRSRHLLASEQRILLGMGLLAAASLNLVSRKTLGLFFERALFSDSRVVDLADKPPFYYDDTFPTHRVPLAAQNYEDVVVASGSIPMVLKGVADISGAPPGVYRDGGVIDYHHDLQHSAADKLTLYPHFYDYIVPGWFDKRLRWRRASPQHTDRTILISPSPEFVATLPNGKIPDRTDFIKLSPAARVKAWRTCVRASERLADDFREILETDQIAARLQEL